MPVSVVHRDNWWKELLRPWIPKPVLAVKKRLYYWLIDPELRTFPLDLFTIRRARGMTLRQRRDYSRRMRLIHSKVQCLHTHQEMLEIVTAILGKSERTDAVVVEAGCFKGGSTAKLSIAAKAAGRRLVVFDSFEGLPEVAPGENFRRGDYSGTLDEVINNVAEYGEPSCCEFVRGWFENTLPSFRRPIAVAFIDVDLVSSTRTCLANFYQLLIPGGSIFSHDGKIELVRQVLEDQTMWRQIGGPTPIIIGLRRRKLVQILKPK